MTFGEKGVNKINKTVLLVGETGAGKSTLINVLVNYSMGVEWEDGVWFQIVDERDKGSQTQSQTSDVIIYEIFGFEGKTVPYSITIIDTPGFGDTGGFKQDENISQRLLDLFRSKQVHEINAVGLVMKASDNRLSDRLSYILNSVTSLFGKDVAKIIVALMTHSDGRIPKNALQALKVANIKGALNEKKQLTYFLFANSQHEERTEDEEFLQNANKLSVKGLKEFTSFLEKIEPQKFEQTVEVLNERIRLTASIQNLKERIKLTDMKQMEIKQTQEALKIHEEEMKNNESFTIEVDEVYKEKEPIDGGMWGLVFYKGATCCTVCEENCHFPGCTMAWDPAYCEVMQNGRCTVCTNKCPVSNHMKENSIYVIKTRRVQKTLDQLMEKSKEEEDDKESCENKSTGINPRAGRQKSNKCEDKQAKIKSILENLKKDLKKLKSEKLEFLDEAFQNVIKLEEIALNADSVSTCVHLDFLIEQLKEEGDPRDKKKVQKLEEMKKRMDEGSRKAMTFKQNQW